MKITILAVFLISLLLLSAENISAQIYKWVDDKGRVHFSDSPTTSNVKNEKEASKENGLEVLKKLDERGASGSRVEKTGSSFRIITKGNTGRA